MNWVHILYLQSVVPALGDWIGLLDYKAQQQQQKQQQQKIQNSNNNDAKKHIKINKSFYLWVIGDEEMRCDSDRERGKLEIRDHYFLFFLKLHEWMWCEDERLRLEWNWVMLGSLEKWI